ncbi:MAG: tetratricopeptide repeat protein, partial [Vulcanimicrobiota bacterium]
MMSQENSENSGLTPELLEIYEEALELIREKKYTAAIRLLIEILEENNSFADAYYQIGYCLNRLKRTRESITYFDAAIRNNPQHIDAYMERATAFSSWGSYPSAVDDLNAILEMDPFNFDAHYYRAKTMIARGMPEKATGDLTFLIRFQPQNPDLYIMRGQAYLTKNVVDKAVEDFDRAMKLKPDMADGYYMKGRAQVHSGDLDAARLSYYKALEQSPENARYHLALGELFFHKEDYEKSLDHLEKSLEYDKHYEISWQVVPIMALILSPDEILEPILDLALNAQAARIEFIKKEEGVQVDIMVYDLAMPLMLLEADAIERMEKYISSLGLDIFSDKGAFAYEYEGKSIQVETSLERDDLGNEKIIMELKDEIKEKEEVKFRDLTDRTQEEAKNSQPGYLGETFDEEKGIQF